MVLREQSPRRELCKALTGEEGVLRRGEKHKQMQSLLPEGSQSGGGKGVSRKPEQCNTRNKRTVDVPSYPSHEAGFV